MPELEIHHEGVETDPKGKRVGVMAALIAVLLAVVTILSHRAHTDAVVFKTETNDQWAFYQAKSIKSHTLGVAHDLVTALRAKSDANQDLLRRYAQERLRYDKECDEIKREAQSLNETSKRRERQALRYDLGEGFLEIGLVLSSMFFIARRMMFPVIGFLAALVGVSLAIAGAVGR